MTNLHLYAQFEQDLTDALGVAMARDGVLCARVWGSLANMQWQHTFSEDLVAYSWRSAGALIAEIRGEGDYMDWYMSGPAGEVHPHVKGALAKFGWSPVPYDEALYTC